MYVEVLPTSSTLDRSSMGGPCVATLDRPRGNSFSSSHHSRRLQPLETINEHMILFSQVFLGAQTMRNYVTNGARTVCPSVCLSVARLACLSVCHVFRCLLSALVEPSLHSNDFNEIFNSQQREFIVLGLKLCTLRQLHVVWPLKNKHPTRVESRRVNSRRVELLEVL